MPIDDLEAAIARLPPGWHAQVFASLDSTQDVAREAAMRGAPDRSLFVADFQRAGRGRQGRRWLAQPGTALLMSVLLRAQGPPVAWRSTALAAVALVEAIHALAPGLRSVVHIKWPNDVLVDRQKVAGILAESSFDGQRSLTIVGLGVNVDADAAALAEVAAPATSLRLATGQPVGRDLLLLELVQRVDAWLSRSEEDLRQAWQAYLWGRGRRLRLREGDASYDVVVLGTTDDGSLIVRLPNGSLQVTSTGELML